MLVDVSSSVVKDRVIMVLVVLPSIHHLHANGISLRSRPKHIYRDIEKIESLIRECLPIPQKLHKVTKRLKTKEEVEQYFPGFMAFTDCSEQPIPRPKNRLRRRLYYSGKRKKHTVKNLYTINQKELIIYKTKHKQIGKRHDYKIYKNNHPNLPNDITSMFDLGFLGVENDYPEQKSSLPIKKKKGSEIITQQKDITEIILKKG